MRLNTEVYVSIDGLNYTKLDLMDDESINVKYVFKDTTNLSKIFSPYSQSFVFQGSLHNQKALGFVGNTSVVKAKQENTFASKIYINGLISETGLLKVTKIKYENSKIKSYTGNFTTSMISLKDRMGDELINDLPENEVTVNWIPNEVHRALSFKPFTDVEPIEGITARWFVPLISNQRVFQHDENINNEVALDNVAFNRTADPLSNNCLKASELNPAVQGRTIIDMIKHRYELDIVMPLENEPFYNDWYIWCNADKKIQQTFVKYVINESFGDPFVFRSENLNDIDLPIKYRIRTDILFDAFIIIREPAASSFYDDYVNLFIKLNSVGLTSGTEAPNVEFLLELENGAIYNQVSGTVDDNNDVEVKFVIPEEDFVDNLFIFFIKLKSDNPIIWNNSEVKIEHKYYDGKRGVFNKTVYADYRQQMLSNNNSAQMSLSNIDLYKSIPETKCTDFLLSFFKTFNISIFEASPNDDKLYWLTPQDLKTINKEYSKKEVDYTDYVTSLDIEKEAPNDYNYYNFKHKSNKYKSNADYKAARGFEFGQLSSPAVKPLRDLREFKVETEFSILEQVPIAGLTNHVTNYGFTSEEPTILQTGETRYKPNTEDLTLFFANNFRNLRFQFGVLDERIGFQAIDNTGNLGVIAVTRYIPTSPIHNFGFSLGFGLVQSSLLESLYFFYYKEQTERLLSPNTLQHRFELELPASELVLNFSTLEAGASKIPDGFRIQNDIIIQENRYSIIDATIDKTTGKAIMNLLNYE